jgi:hypothetical protein
VDSLKPAIVSMTHGELRPDSEHLARRALRYRKRSTLLNGMSLSCDMSKDYRTKGGMPEFCGTIYSRE